MQNRYAGDIGDFGKFGLLKALAGGPNEQRLRIGLIWYLFRDESHNRDGQRTSYARLKHCDEALHSGLCEVSEGVRSVRALEDRRFLPDETCYFGDELSFEGVPQQERAAVRQQWFLKGLAAVRDCDVVCVDPDNGLETRSVGMYARRGPKYAFFEDLRCLTNRNQSVVIYQHRTRTKLTDQVRSRSGQIRTSSQPTA